MNVRIKDSDGNYRPIFSIPALLCVAICGGSALVFAVSTVSAFLDRVDTIGAIDAHPLVTALVVLGLPALAIIFALRCAIRKRLCGDRETCPFSDFLKGCDAPAT